jgi:hypothetical protein
MECVRETTTLGRLFPGSSIRRLRPRSIPAAAIQFTVTVRPGVGDTRWQKDGPLPYDGSKGGVKAPARAGLNLDAPIVE